MSEEIKSKTKEDSFTHYKHQALRAAKDLLYGPDVIKQLNAAKKESEIVRIMKTARNEKFK